MLVIQNKAEVKLYPSPIDVGSKYQSSHGYYRDSDNGVYWERNPPIENGELKVQKAFIKPLRWTARLKEEVWEARLLMAKQLKDKL